ncbi:unnamed protein product, partial [Oikopleura dioica]
GESLILDLLNGKGLCFYLVDKIRRESSPKTKKSKDKDSKKSKKQKKEKRRKVDD